MLTVAARCLGRRPAAALQPSRRFFRRGAPLAQLVPGAWAPPRWTPRAPWSSGAVGRRPSSRRVAPGAPSAARKLVPVRRCAEPTTNRALRSGGECRQPACAMRVLFAGALASRGHGRRYARDRPWPLLPRQFASCCSDALRQSPGSAAGSPCCVWRRPCSRQAMAYSAPLPAGTVVAARSLSGASGRCDATSRSATAAAARLQRGGVGPRGDGAVARARRSSRRVGTAVRDDAACGRRGAGGSAAAWPWTGAGGGKGGPGVQARRRPPRRGRRAEARKRPCLISARRLFSVRSLVYTTIV